MSYNVTAAAVVTSTSSLNNNKSSFALPELSFGSVASLIYPQTFNLLVEQNTTETINLAGIGGSSIKLIAVRSTRPVNLTFVGNPTTFTTPLVTWYMHILSTPEALVNTITSIGVQLGSAPATPPIPLSPSYPSSVVEVFVVI
jgi:hypothetical protein